MKNIFKIFKIDLKSILKNTMVFIVIIGVCIIPSLYAWFNIAANWDPYGSTNGIKVAVSNIDEGYELNGQNINIGDKVVDNLRKNTQMGWEFVSKKDAVEGTYSGKYYAAIVIPSNFSSCIASVLTADIKRPNIIYYSNEKKNAIAPKITDKGASSIQEQVNQTFISEVTETAEEVLEVLLGNIQDGSNNIIDSLNSMLNKASSNLKDTTKAINTFGDTVKSISLLIDTVDTSTPQTDKIIDNSQKALTDLKSLSQSCSSAITSVANSVNNSIESAQNISNKISSLINEAYDLVGTNIDLACEKLQQAIDYCNQIYQINSDIADTLTSINQSLPKPLKAITNLVSNINSINKKISSLSTKLTDNKKSIEHNKKVSDDIKSQTLKLQQQIKSDISSIKSEYTNNIKPSLKSVSTDLDKVITDTQGLLSSVKNTSSDISKIFKKLKTALESSSKALTGTKDIISVAESKIKAVKNHLQEVKDNKDIKQLFNILENDSSDISSFMSSPVKIENQKLYEIENYGSSMSPFYSTLAIWVGGIVLVAILKVNVKHKNRLNNLKLHEEYFGKYLLFFILAEIQATIICLGDLLFLNIQCLNPWLFMVSGWVCAFVFSFIIYTLTVTFSDVGKALAVILLVIQIGGSSGTFPIECTPEFFQNVCPFLPFTYAINAMRECVAGLYSNYFWLDILALLAFVPFVLLLGLVLRRPLVNAKHFFEKRIEDSEIM